MTERNFLMVIGGKLISVDDWLEVRNPATGAVIGEVPDCSDDMLNTAVSAARTAFPTWARMPIKERRSALETVADAIAAHADELKDLLTAEQGKPHVDALGEVMAAAHFLRSIASFSLPIVTNEDTDGRRSVTRRVPIGVVGAIAPWNFPVLLACFKIGPGLLAGNTIVLKPSPYTPLTTLRIGEIANGLLPEACSISLAIGAD
jgi:NAD-dependent aldehyde dehydrogenases